jgi:hypothetical protein
MDPRKWSGPVLALIAFLWIVGAGYMYLRSAVNVMSASGPEGSLIGISAGALRDLMAVTLGPPAMLLLVWLLRRRRRAPPEG